MQKMYLLTDSHFYQLPHQVDALHNTLHSLAGDYAVKPFVARSPHSGHQSSSHASRHLPPHPLSPAITANVYEKAKHMWSTSRSSQPGLSMYTKDELLASSDYDEDARSVEMPNSSEKEHFFNPYEPQHSSSPKRSSPVSIPKSYTKVWREGFNVRCPSPDVPYGAGRTVYERAREARAVTKREGISNLRDVEAQMRAVGEKGGVKGNKAARREDRGARVKEKDAEQRNLMDEWSQSEGVDVD